ncbi:Uncharacterized protein, Rmd1/YagE family [Pseudarcicella hirudinis]|uniref:Uncharacterized protein, Rmd1/YagE family n=1 Tax=Pseudarcicella hirudinis TaxID=1079859 RepID=A0A1I5PFW9_9BACT|nr:RMD1 family protein [Pseudarcicella hirudinis]SFP32730.1 Uncharacterized protein, Rmd1/YagE family [Pseudarcicella hirudinis]
MKIEAFQVSEVFNLKKFRNEYTNQPLIANNSELFYRNEEGNFFYLFSYGVVVFAGFNDLQKSELIKYSKNFAEKEVDGKYFDDFTVNIDPLVSLNIGYDSITIAELTDNIIQIIMLNVGQSVALDYYEALSLEIFTNSKKLTEELEAVGTLRSSKKDLLKFIGRTLNIKNSIIDNLYIFDAPDIVWENELLERIDKGLKKNLDLKMRYQDIDYKLKIIQENLTLFTDLLQNRESTRLEWIIIILILIEVFDIIIKKII